MPKFNTKIAMSLVLDIQDEKDIDYYLSNGADKVVLSTTRNRNFNFLKDCSEKFKGKIVLMANESCLFNCKDRTNHFSFATHCSSSSNSAILDNAFADNYMLSCTRLKLLNLVEFIKSSWIRPEDVPLYEEVGIDYIKLADRTRPETWLLDCYNYYLTEKSPSNFFDLIALTPNNLSNDETLSFPEIFIDSKKLKGFVDFFIEKDIDCLKLQCKECDHCTKYANKAILVDRTKVDSYVEKISLIE